MKKTHTVLMLSVVLWLAGCSSTMEKNTTVETSDFTTYTAEDFFATTSVFGSSINHDGTAVLVSSNETGIFNAYRMPLDGSSKTALTDSTTESVFAISWFPQDDRILYQADEGGNELDHVYVRELDGSITDLTPGDNLKANFAGWHEDELSFYVATNERDPKFFDLYQYQVSDYSRSMVFQNDAGYSVSGTSPNGQWLALSKTNSNADSDIFLVNLQSDNTEPTLITAHEGDVSHSVYTFTRDSKSLIYATNAYGEFNQAWSYDLASGEKQPEYKADWDVSFLYFSKDGQYRVVGVNEDAQTKLYINNTRCLLYTSPSPRD